MKNIRILVLAPEVHLKFCLNTLNIITDMTSMYFHRQ